MQQSHRVPRSLAGIAALAAAVAVSACGTLIKEAADGRWVPMASGGSLVLHQPVTVPRGRTRVFFVNGKMRRSGATYDTSCVLEVRRLDRAGARTIKAGGFEVERVEPYWTMFAQVGELVGPSVRLAGQDGGDGNQMIRTGYRFRLSREGTDVRSLTCLGVMDDPAFAYPPTLAEIDRTLGEVATLRQPGETR